MWITRSWPVICTSGVLMYGSITLAQTCVEGIAASNPTAVYAVASGTVTDLRSGLMWDQCAWGQGGTGCATGVASTLTWQQALAVPASANAAAHKGHADWRIPNIKELRSLVEECRRNSSINEAVFPATSPQGFWSSSPTVGDPNGAWAVSFYDGSTANGDGRTAISPVRLVRAGL